MQDALARSLAQLSHYGPQLCLRDRCVLLRDGFACLADLGPDTRTHGAVALTLVLVLSVSLQCRWMTLCQDGLSSYKTNPATIRAMRRQSTLLTLGRVAPPIRHRAAGDRTIGA